MTGTNERRRSDAWKTAVTTLLETTPPSIPTARTP